MEVIVCRCSSTSLPEDYSSADQEKSIPVAQTVQIRHNPRVVPCWLSVDEIYPCGHSNLIRQREDGRLNVVRCAVEQPRSSDLACDIRGPDEPGVMSLPRKVLHPPIGKQRFHVVREFEAVVWRWWSWREGANFLGSQGPTVHPNLIDRTVEMVVQWVHTPPTEGRRRGPRVEIP